MKTTTVSNWTIIVSLLFYITSLSQTAYCTTDCKSSFMVLLIGILGILTEFGAIVSFIMNKISGHNTSMSSSIGAAFVWLANPLILLSLILIKKRSKSAFILSSISTVLILLFLTFNKVIDDEGGHYRMVTEIKSGYWLWFGSSLTILIGSFVVLKINNNK